MQPLRQTYNFNTYITPLANSNTTKKYIQPLQKKHLNHHAEISNSRHKNFDTKN